MRELRLTTRTGGHTAVKRAVVEAFRSGLRGETLCAGDAGYDAARTIWNAMIDRRPGIIARCASVADVARSIEFARTHDLLVAVRGGGHNVSGNAVCEGGIMIDLSPLKGAIVDPVQRTVRAEAGLNWGELDAVTQRESLATTGGLVTTTGIAGLTLGGGQGWLMRKYGLTCDNLLSVDLVTADGKFLTASPRENADLFWGLCGGGGNFGVATSFTYRLHRVGPHVLGGLIAYPMDRTSEILRFYRDFTRDAPDELTAHAVLTKLPADGVTPVVAIVVCYCGSLQEGERVVRPLRALCPPLVDTIGPTPYTTIQQILDSTNPPSGYRWYYKSNFLSGLGDEAIAAMLACSTRLPSPLSRILVEHHGGAMARVGKEETAYRYRDGKYNAVVITGWTDAADDAINIEWARATLRALEPFSSEGVYVNYLDGDEGSGRVEAAYGAANYRRLVALKNVYDPDNFFRLNHNIMPTA
jgi:FAD/FMN-containing dehydrogenase